MSRNSKKILAAFVVLPLVLSGCARITIENAYPEATNARECQVLYEADVRNTRTVQSVNTSSSGNPLIDAFASGLGKGVAESTTNTRLAACLQRIGAPAPIQPVSGGLQPLNSAPQATVPAPQSVRAICKPGNGLMVLGDSYCVGNL